ncbi:SDR family NAD(P)-dependent oxidoreductase [Chitinophaga sp.]|uniref:type I polyketide synthase n=1 Tax=Chitinophaga sp. TaxID=1869181 RepID=UPI0031D023FA
MKADPKYSGLEIAITGMTCVVPGATDWRAFWDNLVKEKEGISFYSRAELEALEFEEKTIVDPRYVPARGDLRDKDLFDAAFFDYTPLEASLMNPANRVFHQMVWTALEDAGYNPDNIKGPIGLYAGAGDDSNWILYARLKNQQKELDDFSLNNIANKDFLATLVSYKLNLKGPAVSVNTTCSTSLVAIHQACKSLLLGEAEIALAGGLTIRSEPQLGYFYSEGLIFSADGHCRAFDKDASGTVATEGAGIVVLKRLSKAIEDKDHIYAIIKGGAVNNDGNRKVGFMASSVEGQFDCIRKAHRFAKVAPESISYVEAHGTGTRLGDPIEVEALNIAFNNNKAHRCALGSVKTNIGHLDIAAGVAGLIKAALCLKYRQLPASLHFKQANPEVDFENGPFYINTRLKSWESADAGPLRAGVSSFGIGGTNAHLVLEEAPASESGAERSYKLMSISARSRQSVIRYLEKMKHFIAGPEKVSGSDMCYTLHTGRKAFPYRLSVAFRDNDELKSLLENPELQSGITKASGHSPAIVFMFPGQGSQYAGMGKQLYAENAVFRAQMDKGFALLQQWTGAAFKGFLFDAALINNTRYAQPLLFLFEYSLAMMLQSFGLTAQYMIGHSIGEYVAACISGVFSFEEGLRLVMQRGSLMSMAEKGIMLSIPLAKEEVLPYLNEQVSLAAVNGPSQVVLSGSMAVMEALKERLHAEDVPFVQLHTSHAFHSYMLDPIRTDFCKALEQIRFSKPAIPFVSNLSGKLTGEQEVLDISYWWRHTRETVQFSNGIATLLKQKEDLIFIEVGAGHSLLSLLRQQQPGVKGLSLLPGAKENVEDNLHFTAGLGQLWAYGVNINWELYYQGETRYKVSLPTYSFEPVRYPTEVNPFAAGVPDALLGLKGTSELKDWLFYTSWKRVFAGPAIPRAKDGKRVWLLLSFDAQSSIKIKAALIAQDPDCVVIEVVHGAEYDQLLQELAREKLFVTDLIYGWGIQTTRHQYMQQFWGLVYLVQSLRSNNMLKELRIAVLTDRLYQITGKEAGNYQQSLLLGLVNVLPQEYSVTCFNIDLSLEEDLDSTMPLLVRELICNSGRKDRITGLRNGHRWIREFEKNSVLTTDDPLRQEGVYLITGGLGNVGYILSRFLLENYNAKIVLTGRSDENALKEQARQRYKELKAVSGNVCYYKVNVADASMLEQVVATVEEQWGRISGVIHTAGIITDEYFELVEDMTPAKVQALFEPKVQGVQHLHEVFKKRAPDFVWLSSSLSSVLGGLGFGAYAAANLFMDHFVLSLPAGPTRWRSVNLAGMAFTAGDIAKESGRNRFLLKPEELCRLFVWSLGIQESPVIIQTVEDLAARHHGVYEVRKTAYLDEDDPETELSQKTERPGLSTAYTQPENEMEQRMVHLFERFFGIAGIGTGDSFFELGGDSLKAMMMVKRIKNEFDINLSLTDFFNHDKPGLCAGLVERLKPTTDVPQRTSRIII